MRAPLWLAHHPEAELSRCLNLGGLHVCARCSGLLPSLLVAMWLSMRYPLNLPARVVLALEITLLVPGLWDAARARFDPQSGNNLGRLLSGAGIGTTLGYAAVIVHRQGLVPQATLPLLLSAIATIWALGRQRGQLTDGAWEGAGRD